MTHSEGKLERGPNRLSGSSFATAVEDATISLLRITLVFGLACAAILLLLALADGDAASIAVTFGWTVAWAIAVARPESIASAIREHATVFTIGLTIASALAIVATGGLESIAIVDANWIVWSASVVVSARVVFGIAGAISASHLCAFLIAGMPASAVFSGADAYAVVTQILNPLVIAVAALALTGVFRSLLCRTPELLAEWRSGAATPAQLRGRQLLELPPGSVRPAPQPLGHMSDLLTPAEADVVARLATGAKPKQIAHDTRRSVATVYEHIANAKRKCAARTTAQLVTRAWQPTG